MQIDIKPGTYVVAVSGGVDSMALLDMLRQKPELRLIVAHFDHGIREDSVEDRKHVQQMAEQRGLPFVYHEGKLGAQASEDTARKARYEFLHKVREAAGADAILTAHHHDDALETAVHNLIRGTGRKGLSSLKDAEHVKRPLIKIPKQQLKTYAEDQKLKWREDSTNEDFRYTRNYIRHKILPKLTLEQKATLLRHIEKARDRNKTIDTALSKILEAYIGPNGMDRQKFIKLPHIVAREVLAAWLRRNGATGFDRKLLEQLVIAAKTYAHGKAAHIDRDHYLQINKTDLALKTFER
jgi:tRNA(Ile)-lysidine synthetase-like protein